MDAAPIDPAELLAGIDHSMLHFESQETYATGAEGVFQRWLDGDRRPAIELDEGLARFFEMVAGHTAAGRKVSRVKVFEDPPTPYQRFELDNVPTNLAAGESVSIINRADAERIGLMPAAARHGDWWLLDDRLVLASRFDGAGRVASRQVIDDPEVVAQFRQWWELAIRHANPLAR